jgi:hypothetical protein
MLRREGNVTPFQGEGIGRNLILLERHKPKWHSFLSFLEDEEAHHISLFLTLQGLNKKVASLQKL